VFTAAALLLRNLLVRRSMRNREMSIDQLPEKRTFLGRAIWLGLPIVVGVLVDGASESLKFVARAVSNHIIDRIGFTLADPLVLGLCMLLLGAAILMYEKVIGDTQPLVRSLLLVLSLVIAGALEPWGLLLTRGPILDAYDKVQLGVDSLTDVRRRFPASPLVELHDYKHLNPEGSHIYCAQGCSVRLTYDVPSLWHRPFVYIDFDSDSNSKEPKATFKDYVP
jgi:hypothetical protein